jgi:crotonobetainyl-CoA:carnitine CoA-transferase CaiB-like acyl-CoA transferase
LVRYSTTAIPAGRTRRGCRTPPVSPARDDPRYDTNPKREARERELAAMIQVVTMTVTTAHWYRLLGEAGVPCGPLRDFADLVEDEHVRARGMTVEADHPRAGPTKLLGSAIRLAGCRLLIRRPAPLLGEHSREILEAAGYRPAKADRLLAAGVTALPRRPARRGPLGTTEPAHRRRGTARA